MVPVRTSLPFVLLALAACSVPTPEPRNEAPRTGDAWRTLFDGASLDGWEITAFGGEGPVEIEDGRLVLGMGSPLTGVTWVGEPLPTVDYEVELEAARLAGTDFFCGLTFPVRDACASLILGGWGGTLCGISSLDGLDAAENETTRYLYLETGKTYHVRLRVEEDRIEAWLDGEPLVDVSTEGRVIDVRPEVERSKPFGIASFATRAAIGPVRIRRL